jgi:hypothetical protein
MRYDADCKAQTEAHALTEASLASSASTVPVTAL